MGRTFQHVQCGLQRQFRRRENLQPLINKTILYYHTQPCLSELLTNSAQVLRRKELVPYIILRRRKQHSSVAIAGCLSTRIYVQTGLQVFCQIFFLQISIWILFTYNVQTTSFMFYDFYFLISVISQKIAFACM